MTIIGKTFICGKRTAKDILIGETFIYGNNWGTFICGKRTAKVKDILIEEFLF